MAVKTANVNSRMKLDIKQQAESILDRLGIPRSVAIDMYYRQIIAHNGIPFSVTLPTTVPARDEITSAQFDQMMTTGLRQAKEDDSFDADEVFAKLEQEENV
ncbi:MAG: type II toxin-antitoxin system RelB/DinJ family antitoxin [Eubacterium sp.]|nr:type II toxin-antitoxin system RelB/DinJ family antitoxin [Eubacterium sp.]